MNHCPRCNTLTNAPGPCPNCVQTAFDPNNLPTIPRTAPGQGVKCFMVRRVMAKKTGRFRFWVRDDTKEKFTQLPPGAMWFEETYSSAWDNEPDPVVFNPHEDPDGDLILYRHLFVCCPDDSIWDIDSRASNCTLPGDRQHRCWVRVGVPPLVTVGKVAGVTCSAGAGSIATGGYHGFLVEGVFTP